MNSVASDALFGQGRRERERVDGLHLAQVTVGMAAIWPDIFCRADASADGLPVSSAPVRSADSSR